MFKNYLTTAWRHLLKHKSFSVINILGLAIGIAACMLIYLYVQNELTYDQYNSKTDRIARVTTTIHAPESDVSVAVSLTPLADVLMREYPEVESVVRMERVQESVMLENELLREEDFFKSDQTVFTVFDFTFLEGAAAGALEHPNSIVITKSIADKYFHQQPARGKILRCNDVDWQVTGVVADRPANSDMHIDALLSADFSKLTKWMENFSAYTFILFKSTPDYKAFEPKLAAISEKYVQPELNGMDAVKYKAIFNLEPLREVHFSKGKYGDTPKGDKQFNYIFSLLAVFILVIALLNYINQSTAKATERAKEVGIRKVSGALPFQLIRQFLFESFLLVAIAWLLAVAMVLIGLPFFNKLLQTKLVFGGMQNILFMTGMFFITFILAGLYPAFVLSGFRPIRVLKGNFRTTIKGIFLRKAVTITQFAIAAALILGTTSIYSQMKFIQNKNLGYNKDQVLSVFLPGDSASESAVTAFQNALRQRPEVKDLTVGTRMSELGLTLSSTNIEVNGKKRELMCNYFQIDPRYLPVFQIKLLEGRNISDSYGTDKKEAFIVNEAFVKMTGWKSAIGKDIEGFFHKGKIVGVVNNYYYKSLHNLVEPLVLVYRGNREANATTIKINPRDLSVVRELHKKYFPTTFFEYTFFDDMVNNYYQRDHITLSLFNGFTLLAIFVCCLGLYGLVALIAVQRSKEVSIRKVLGASLAQLLSLMTKDFVRLVGIAVLIALPVAGFVMNKWLSAYAYHTRMEWWMFVIPVLLVFVIALGVISKEIIKTVLTNPVKNLRSE